jgi:hypothetical protein
MRDRQDKRNSSPVPTLSCKEPSQEAIMSEWRDTMVDRPAADDAAYMTGWTISGLAVLGTIVAVWILGI